MNFKKTPLQEAYERCASMRRALSEMNARCIEVTEDKAGILWERWVLPNGISMVLFSTPSWWDAYLPADNNVMSEEWTIEAVRIAGTVNNER